MNPGLYRELLTPETFRFARQAGVTRIVAHLPGHFTRGQSKTDCAAPWHAGMAYTLGWMRAALTAAQRA
jgi:hypothetical protein